MAKLSAHGRELDRREYFTCRVAVMSDGHIMKDSGSGWKLWKKIKPEFDIANYAKEVRKSYDARHPLFHAYVQALIDSTNIKYRGMLHELVSLMPSDPDGVYGEFNDYAMSHGIDLSDTVQLCRLYSAMLAYGSQPKNAE